MTKAEYVEEILEEILRVYQIPVEVLKQCAEDIVDGLDVWYEMSGDSIASSNRYGYLEREIEDIKKKAQKELEDADTEYKEQLKEIDRNARWKYQQYQRKIEELEKQVNK